MELLHRTFGATLCKTELELAYFPRNGAITDFSVEIDGVELGVSVTRACAYGAFDAKRSCAEVDGRAALDGDVLQRRVVAADPPCGPRAASRRRCAARSSTSSLPSSATRWCS